MNEPRDMLKSITQLSRDEVGKSEENVKQKIVVPLLECLGHNRTQLDFEYCTGNKRIDIFIKDLPIDCKIIIDTKNYDEDLNNHLEQIGLYAFQEGALLALIINGDEIRIYDPFFRGFSFKDSLLYSFKRNELNRDSNFQTLHNLLSRDSIKTRKVKEYIVAREQEIMDTYSSIEDIKIKFDRRKTELAEQKEILIRKVDAIQSDIRKITAEINQLDSERNLEINSVLRQMDLPYIRETPQEISPSDVQEIRTRNVFSKYADRIEINMNKKNSPSKWGLIPIPREYRSFFPGYKVDFLLQTDIGELNVKVTSGPKGTRIGDPEAGNYITGGLKPWYDRHQHLKDGDTIIVEVIEPKRKYKLSIA
jgi:hypothetical protein